MNLRQRFRRWRALRVPELTASTREGAIVQATGVARACEAPLIAPLAGSACVVVSTKYTMPQPQGTHPPRVTVVERMQIRPFVLETRTRTVLVEAGHVDLLLPDRAEGNIQEIRVEVGQRVTVVGSVLRDGAQRPRGDIAFRDSEPACMLVGSKRHPVVITASVSDDDDG